MDCLPGKDYCSHRRPRRAQSLVHRESLARKIMRGCSRRWVGGERSETTPEGLRIAVLAVSCYEDDDDDGEPCPGTMSSTSRDL